MTHYLYLVRHGEHLDAEHGLEDGPLSPRGRRQAELIADRLSGVPLDAVWHSPLERATETARVVAERLPAASTEPHARRFAGVPRGSTPALPQASVWLLGAAAPAAAEAGAAQMADAAVEFLALKRGSHELLITHNFVIAWFVREVLEAPAWRWVTLNQANCGLTVLAQRPGRPWTVATHNDLSHLPVELRTGLPEPLPV